MSTPRNTNVIFDELKNVIQDLDNTVGTAVSNLHGTIVDYALDSTATTPAVWLLMSAGNFNALPSYVNLADVIAHEQPGHTFLKDSDTQVSFRPTLQDAAKAHLLLGSVSPTGTIDFPIKITAPGYDIALYINKLSVKTGRNKIEYTQTVSGERQDVAIVLYGGGTNPVTVETPAHLPIYGQIPRPAPPQWVGLPSSNYVALNVQQLVNTLQWQNDPFAASWNVYRAEGFTIGAANVVVDNADGTFKLTFNSVDLTDTVKKGTTLYTPLWPAGRIVSVAYVTTNTEITVVVDSKADPTATNWDDVAYGYEFYYTGTFNALPRVAYRSASTITWQDTAITQDTLYVYRVSAMDFVSQSVESLASKQLAIWVGGPQKLNNAYVTHISHVVENTTSIAEYIRPNADVGTPDWNEIGPGTTNWEAIDDTTSDTDTSYIYTPESLSTYPTLTTHVSEIALSNPVGTPGTSGNVQGMRFRFDVKRVNSAGAGYIDLTVKLKDSATAEVIKTFSLSNSEITTGWTTHTVVLSNAEVEAIDDALSHNDLTLEFTAHGAIYDEGSGTTELRVSWAELEYFSKAAAIRGSYIDLHYDVTSSVDELDIQIDYNDQVPAVQSYSYTVFGINGADGTHRIQGGSGDFLYRDDYSDLVITIIPVAQPGDHPGATTVIDVEDYVSSPAGTALKRTVGGTEILKADYAVAGVNVSISTDADGRPTINAGIGSSSLGDLTDVIITGTPADNEVLAYNTGTAQWINQTAAEAGLATSSHAHALADLSNVVITSVADNEVLAYNNATSQWVNQTAAEAGLATSGHIHALADLSNVVITSVADNEVLAYNNATSQWINQTATEAGLAAASHTHSAADITAGTFASGDFVFQANVRIGNGAAATPSLNFTSETTSGLYRVGTGGVGVSVAGVSKMVFTSSNISISSNVTPSGTRDLGGSGFAWNKIWTNDIDITGILNIGDGTLAGPAYSFSSDTNTGMYRSAVDTLNLVVGGATALDMDTGEVVSRKAFRVNLSPVNLPHLTLTDSGGGTDTIQQMYINFENNVGTEKGYIGFYANTDTDFTVANGIGDIVLSATGVIEAGTTLQVSAGSAATPGIGFTAETGLGWYRVAAGQMGLAGGHLLPEIDSTYDLGTTTVRWRRLYTDDITLTNAFTFPDGSAAAPSINFTGATTAGLYHNGGGGIGFATVGANRMTIGTASIGMNLDVLPNADNTQDLGSVSFRWAEGRFVTAYADTILMQNTLTGDNFLDWGGTGASYFKKITDQGGLGIAADSSIVILAGDTMAAYLTGAGIISTTTAEDLHLAADSAIIIAPGQQSGYTTAFRWDFHSAGTLRAYQNGAAATPTYSFNSDTDTGMYLGAVGELNFTVASANRFSISAIRVRPLVPMRGENGSSTEPTYSFINDIDTGMYLAGTGSVVISAANSTNINIDAVNNIVKVNKRFEVSTTGEMIKLIDSSTAGSPYISFFQTTTRRGYIQMQDVADTLKLASEYGNVDLYYGSAGTALLGFRVSSSQVLSALSGTNSAPGYSFTDDTNTGMYRQAADVLSFATQGARRVEIDGTSGTTTGTITIDNAHIGVSIQTLGNATTVNFRSGNVAHLTNNGARTIALDFEVNGFTYILIIEAITGANATWTWPTNVKWSGGAPPLTTTVGRYDIIYLCAGNNFLFGSYTLNHT